MVKALELTTLAKRLESIPQDSDLYYKSIQHDLWGHLDRIGPCEATYNYFSHQEVERLSILYEVSHNSVMRQDLSSIQFGSLILFDSEWKVILWLDKDRSDGEWRTYRGFIHPKSC